MIMIVLSINVYKMYYVYMVDIMGIQYRQARVLEKRLVHNSIVKFIIFPSE